MEPKAKMLCKFYFGKGCENPNCQFSHVSPCKFGKDCKKPNCKFSHIKDDDEIIPEIPPLVHTKSWKPRPSAIDRITKPKPKPDTKEEKKYCKNFRSGTCQNNNCHFNHNWIDSEDIILLYKKFFGTNTQTDEYEIKDVCVINKKIFVFGLPKFICTVNLDKILTSSSDVEIKQMKEAEELTCLKYLDEVFSNAIIIGLYNHTLKCAQVKIIFFDGSEVYINPAHEDYIVDVSNIDKNLFTASWDRKIKCWQWNEKTMNFDLIFTYNNKRSISKMIIWTVNRQMSGELDYYIFVTNNEDFSLSIYKLNTVHLTLDLIKNYENYHNNVITSLKLIFTNQQKILLTSSYDGTVKLLNMEKEDDVLMQQGFEISIASVEIVPNGAEKFILAIGFSNGNIGLYELINYRFEEFGKLILHKPRVISSLYAFYDSINDVGRYYMIVGDNGGRISIWQFLKERPNKYEKKISNK